MTRVGILSPTGILGYGFPESSLEHGLELQPDVIGVDGPTRAPATSAAALRTSRGRPCCATSSCC